MDAAWFSHKGHAGRTTLPREHIYKCAMCERPCHAIHPNNTRTPGTAATAAAYIYESTAVSIWAKRYGIRDDDSGDAADEDDDNDGAAATLI